MASWPRLGTWGLILTRDAASCSFRAHARSLGSARLLQTDDTPARCPELTRAKTGKEKDESFVLPWANLKHKSDSKTTPPLEPTPLVERLSFELGFENQNKTGSPRKDFNTTVVVGK